MKQEVLKNFDLTWIPVTGLVLFATCFAVYCFWTFRKENKSLYLDVANVPLNDPAKASGLVGGNEK